MKHELAFLAAFCSVLFVDGVSAQPGATSRPAFPFSRPSDPEDAQRMDDMRQWMNERRQAGAPDMADWTEAEMATYNDLLARTHLMQLKREFELTPDETQAVKRRLDELIEESNAYWRTKQAELRAVRAQIRALPQDYRDPDVSEKRRSLSRQQGEIMMNNPLHHKIVRPAIEKILPPEKIRARDERQAKEREAARGEMEGRSREMELRMREAEERARMGMPMERRAAKAQRLRMLMSPFFSDRWEQYVREFIQVYELSPAQQESAQSTLREMTARRSQYEQTHAAQRAEFRNIKDAKERLQKLETWNEPIRAMFEELKKKLDDIPTTAQRDAVAKDDADDAPTTRPAEPASRPAEAP